MAFNEYDSSDDHQPVLWVRGHAIYASHLLAIVFAASMILTSVFMGFRAQAWLNWLTFDSAAVLRGQIWRVISYGLVNPPSLWFVVDAFLLVWFGRELEKFLGRRTFLLLYTGLYLLPPVLFTVVGLWLPLQLSGMPGAFAIFVAFATLYPNVVMLFNLLAKWVAAILFGIYTLMGLSQNDVTGLMSLWATAGFACAFISYQQGRFKLPDLRFWQSKPKLRVLPDLKPPAKARPVDPLEEPAADVDALLDKISRSGMASLTARERAALDAARANLLKKNAAGRR